jgi:anti-sigma factor RsiW
VSEIAEGCRGFDEDLSALIDAELGPERRAQLEAHLAGCSRCSARLAELRAVDRALASLPAPAVRGELGAKLAERLVRERAAVGSAAERVEAERGARPPGAWPPSGRRAFARPPRLRPSARRLVAALAIPTAAAAALALYLALQPATPPAGLPGKPVAAAEGPVAPALAAPAPAAPGAETAGEQQLARTGPRAAPAAEPGVGPPEAKAPLRAGAPQATQIAEGGRAGAGESELESLGVEDLGVVLELSTIEDLPVIANLDLLERLLEMEAG